MSRPRVALATLGCKVNQYDSQALAELFGRHGFEVVSFEEQADVYVINTCAVTAEGERSSRQAIRRAVRRAAGRAAVMVTGCLAQAEGERVAATGVTAVVGPDRRARLVELALRWIDRQAQSAPARWVDVAPALRRLRPPYEELPVTAFGGRSRAVVKVQDGCDEMCAFCIVPYTRGPSRSRPPEAVEAEVRRLVEAGYQEIVVSGVHLGLYGRDLGAGRSLVDLLRRLERLTGRFRLRLSSLLPGHVDDELIGWFGESSRLCPHVHLSIQSGDDAVIAAMNRRYRADDVRRAVDRLRRIRPDLAVTVDVIVGFPGETEEAFLHTAQLLQQIEVARAHVFPYSPRPGTRAADREDTVPAKEKRRRVHALLELADRLALAYHNRLVGREVEVLVEPSNGPDGALEGVDEHYVRTRLEGSPGAGWRPGSLVRARVESAGSQRVWAVPLTPLPA